jgi:hypothetical protein
MKFRCTLNFLILTTLAVMNKFFSGYKRKERDSEVDSVIDSKAISSKQTACRKP